MAGNRKKPGLVLSAPETLSLEGEHRKDFLGLLYRYRWDVFVRPRIERAAPRVVSIDLSTVEQLELDAALVLTAEYWRSLRETGYRPIINDADWKPPVCALLEQLGFYEFVEATARMRGALDGDNQPSRQFVRFQTEKAVVGARANQIIDALEAAAGAAPARQIVYGGLVEAMMNVNNHAYKDLPPQVYGVVPNWWIAGSFDASSETLEFVAYDQGMGIPTSIPRDETYLTRLTRLIRGPREADLIEAAIELGRTSTDRPERGNGMWTICSVADELEGSSVRILSGRGDLTYRSDGSFEKKDHANPFCGTLIKWTLKLPSEPSEPTASSQ